MVMADPFRLGNLASPRVFAKARHAVVSDTLVIVPEFTGKQERTELLLVCRPFTN
jgi:hypothetical protein